MSFIYSKERFGNIERFSQIAKDADSLYQYMYQDDEIVQLMQLLDKELPKDSNFIEIGSALGGSFHCFGSVLPNGRKISVDVTIDDSKMPYPSFVTLDGYIEKRWENWNKNFTDVHSILGDSLSQETIDKVKNILEDKKVNFILIDGDHSHEYIKWDTLKYLQFVNDDGILAYHDIFGQYRGFWAELISFYPNECIEIKSQFTGDEDNRHYETDRFGEKVKGPGIGVLKLNKEIKEDLLKKYNAL
jgi:hypothetical protein